MTDPAFPAGQALAGSAGKPAAAPARYLVVGANHASSTVDLRDRLFVDERRAPDFLAGLAARGVAQCLVLSTCDRVELQAAHADPEAAAPLLREALAAEAGLDPARCEKEIYGLRDADAVRHVFAVAASLDSLVIGEPQVLGQLKDAHRLAETAGTMGPELLRLLQAAYAAAKRVRAETKIAEGPVTLASSALQVARSIHGDLGRAAALLVGPGEMGELIALRLREAGLARLAVAAPSPQRAAAAARRLDCQGVAFDTLPAALEAADIVICGLGAGRHLVTAAMVEHALKRRRFRPMFLIDAALPADIEPAVDRLAEAFLYDLDDLEAVALETRATRARAAAAAWAILDEELARFLADRAARQAVPTLASLRAHFEAARGEALARAPADAVEATRWLIARLLHRPQEALREAAASGAPLDPAARRLFGLDSGEAAADNGPAKDGDEKP